MVEYLGTLPHVPKEMSLTLDTAGIMYSRLKDVMYHLVWGHLFPEVGIILTVKLLITIWALANDAAVFYLT